ncbi:MAG: hypothetical protein ACRD20_10725 [Terriglobales bacterium]
MRFARRAPPIPLIFHLVLAIPAVCFAADQWIAAQNAPNAQALN